MWLFSARKTRHSRPDCRVPPSGQPRLEILEDRCLLSAGALDPTFGNGAGYVTTAATNKDNSAQSVLIQADGKILVAGNGYNGSKNAAAPEVFAVVRYNSNGGLDTSFGSGGRAIAEFPADLYGASYSLQFDAALYPQAGTVNDGKIVLAGGHQIKGSGSPFALARFNTNGTLDATFGTDKRRPGEVVTLFPVLLPLSEGGARGVVIQSDGKIVAAGASTTGFVLARYNANGTLDTTFDGDGMVVTSLGGRTEVGELLLQPDGKLIVVGDTNTGSGWVWKMARYNPNGSLDTTGFGSGGFVTGPFGAVAYSTAYDAALYPSGTGNVGKIIVVGDWDGPADNQAALARFNPNGTLDSTFGTGGEVLLTLGGNSVAKSVAIAPDGKLVVPGAYNGIGEFAVARFNNDGSFDTTFGAGGIVTTDIGDGASGSRAVALQSNGDIVVAGSAYLGGTPNFAVARYLPSAPQVGSFTASPNPVPSGSNLALTASGITDGNPNGTVTQVAFYRDSNGDGKLDANDALLGYGSQSNGVWAFSFSTTGLTAGTYTLFAQAKDSFGVLGDPFALALTVQ